MTVYRSSSKGNTPGPSTIDDGTNITVSIGATALFRVVKATGQFQVAAGYDSDVTF